MHAEGEHLSEQAGIVKYDEGWGIFTDNSTCDSAGCSLRIMERLHTCKLGQSIEQICHRMKLHEGMRRPAVLLVGMM